MHERVYSAYWANIKIKHEDCLIYCSYLSVNYIKLLIKTYKIRLNLNTRLTALCATQEQQTRQTYPWVISKIA